MRLTLKNGHSEYSPLALCFYGMVLAGMGEDDESYRMSQLALRFVETKSAVPGTTLLVYVFSFAP